MAFVPGCSRSGFKKDFYQMERSSLMFAATAHLQPPKSLPQAFAQASPVKTLVSEAYEKY